MNSIEQALKIAEQHNFRAVRQMCLPRNYLIQKCSCWASNAPGSTGKFTGRRSGLYLDYDQNRAMLNTLNVGPTLIRVFRPIAICVRRKNR